MKYALSIITSLALLSLMGVFLTTTAEAAPAIDGSASLYLLPSSTQAHGYVKPDDYD